MDEMEWVEFQMIQEDGGWLADDANSAYSTKRLKNMRCKKYENFEKSFSHFTTQPNRFRVLFLAHKTEAAASSTTSTLLCK